MGWLTGLMQPRAALSADPEDDRVWSSYASQMALSGELVNHDTALKLSTAWAGVHLIANSIGMLPMAVYQRLARGRREAVEHPLWDLLHTQPNPSQTAGEFKAMLTAHALLRGGGYAEIVPGPRGPVDQLRPVHPDRVTAVELLDNNELQFRVKPANGIGPEKAWPQERMFYLRGLSLDGITGVSFVRYGVESLGLARAAEAYAARVYRNDATPRGVLEHPGKLTESSVKRLKDSWETQHTGANQHRPAVLEEGMKFHEISMSPEDTQMLASREYQDVDIARWLGVPLFLLQIMTKSTAWGSGLEQIWEVFIATGLGFWASRWEQAIARDLIAAPQRYYVKINLTALIRGDIEKRSNAYNTGIMAGYLTRNEAREKEDLNALPGLDDPLVPLNMRGMSDPVGVEQRGREAEDEGRTSNAEREGHYRALLEESAGRVVRKEIAALTGAARRWGEDFDGFAADVQKFYELHAQFVAQTLRMPLAPAQEYVAAQLAAALGWGTPAMMLDEGACVARLCELAGGG